MILSLLVLGCAKSSEETKTTVSGNDYSGTYALSGVECYNSALSALTNVATVTNGFSESVVISGNSLTATDTQGACTVVFTGDIVFSSSTLSLTNRKVASATGGACSLTLTLSAGAITPNSSTTAYNPSSALTSLTNALYIRSETTGAVWLPSVHTDGAGGYCFLKYIKQ